LIPYSAKVVPAAKVPTSGEKTIEVTAVVPKPSANALFRFIKDVVLPLFESNPAIDLIVLFFVVDA
jgi:hypothetical protein